jgi:hypothetical protein
VIDAGLLGAGAAGAVAALAPHAILLVANIADLGAAQAHQQLLQAGFHHVTIFIAGPPDAAAASDAAPGLDAEMGESDAAAASEAEAA